jgi:hypothetical protein
LVAAALSVTVKVSAVGADRIGALNQRSVPEAPDPRIVGAGVTPVNVIVEMVPLGAMAGMNTISPADACRVGAATTVTTTGEEVAVDTGVPETTVTRTGVDVDPLSAVTVTGALVADTALETVTVTGVDVSEVDGGPVTNTVTGALVAIRTP